MCGQEFEEKIRAQLKTGMRFSIAITKKQIIIVVTVLSIQSNDCLMYQLQEIADNFRH